MLILVLLVLLVLFLLGGRRNHPGLDALRGHRYAHRGLHSPGVPENSLAAFRAAVEKGFGAELDVHLLSDGNLAVIHDSKLMRTTGREGRVEDLTTDRLKEYFLEGTAETIPEFADVLDTFAGKTPLIVELKSVDGNHAALTRAVCDMLESYPGAYCLESFDPRCVAWLKRNRPHLIRGQLAEDFTVSGNGLPWLLNFAMTHNLLNFTTRPDFIAYKFSDRHKTPSAWLCRRVLGLQGVTWTLRTREDFAAAEQEGWLPIFENFIP